MLLSAPATSKFCRLCFKPCLFLILIYLLFVLTAYSEYKGNNVKPTEAANISMLLHKASNYNASYGDDGRNIPITSSDDHDNQKEEPRITRNTEEKAKLKTKVTHEPTKGNIEKITIDSTNKKQQELTSSGKENMTEQLKGAEHSEDDQHANASIINMDEVHADDLVDDVLADDLIDELFADDEIDTQDDHMIQEMLNEIVDEGAEIAHNEDSAQRTIKSDEAPLFLSDLPPVEKVIEHLLASNESDANLESMATTNPEVVKFSHIENSEAATNSKEFDVVINKIVPNFYAMLENPPARCNRILQVGGDYIHGLNNQLIKDGQKYVCEDAAEPNFQPVKKGNCTVYSFG